MLCSDCKAKALSNNTTERCSVCGTELAQSQEDLATRALSEGHGRDADTPASDSRAGDATRVAPARTLSNPVAGIDDATADSSSDFIDRTDGAGIGPGWSAAVTPSSYARAAAGHLAVGSWLGDRYEILRALGEGGMGAVYKARDMEVDRLVAIKVIRPDLANNAYILQRFKQELILARQVTHPNVVRIFDLGVADGLKFISMEYIEGREITDILAEKRKFPPREAAEVILQACRGLAAAHSQGVIHRDLKPQNIMIDIRGRIAVMDFGIAFSTEVKDSGESNGNQTQHARADLTEIGALIGTPRYMSPEQARCEPVDASSDIFTVGLIFYELLTGKVPFLGATAKETLLKRTAEAPTPPVELNPEVPKRLNEIVLKCLEKEPARRYPSASELVHDLEVWLGIRSTVGAKQMTRWRWVASGLAALLLVAAGIVIRDEVNARKARVHPTVKLLISDFRNRSGDPVLEGAIEPMFQVALEGASFITSFNRGQARKIAEQLKPGVKNLDQSVARLVAMREGVPVVISGSVERKPDGYRLSAAAIDASKGNTLISRDADVSSERELPKAVDKIASRIRSALGDSAASSHNTAAETFTSTSLTAAQKYAQAQELQWSGKWEQAIAAYREATQIDPKLSRAYAGIAAMLANLGRRQEAEHYYRLALAHIDQESDREKYRTRGGYYLLMREYHNAKEQFETLVKQYPADTAGIANLALADFYSRDMKAALEEGRRAIKIYPDNLLQRNNVGLYAMYAGDFDTAIQESKTILKMNPSFEKAYLCLGLSEAGRGADAEAEQAYTQMAPLSAWGASEASLARADLATYEGRYAAALKILDEGTKADLEKTNTSAAALKLIVSAGDHLQRGERAAAMQDAAKALALSDEENILYLIAHIHVEGGKNADALGLAAKLSSKFGPEPRALAKLIEGETQLASGKLHEAVTSFQDSQKLADTWLGRFDLGRAYLKAEQYPDAESEFDLCLKRRGEATSVFLDDEPTLRYLPPVYYCRALAREGLGSAGAAEDLKAFLAIKQNSDPDPQVADARRRVKAQ
ncbi:MAG: protein kinase [Acidobacteriaceae bacterium]|nr:protein kinase [Acidobacteriaceae bacterium]MBV9779881.1 protein kinase [Acidobacteriaceae bacterium]